MNKNNLALGFVLFSIVATGIALAAITLTIDSPKADNSNGDWPNVYGTTTISVSSIGNGTISKMNFYIDNRSNKIGEDSMLPYSYDWDTSPYYDSTKFSLIGGQLRGLNFHSIIASAVDASGTELASATRIVNVTNGTSSSGGNQSGGGSGYNYTSCTDSDGGKNTSVQGTVTITGIATVKETDNCWDNGDVAERYCKASQGNRPSDLIGNERITCASGYTCSVGKCVEVFAPPSPAPQQPSQLPQEKPKVTPIEQVKEERESNPNPIAAVIYSIVDFIRSLFGGK